MKPTTIRICIMLQMLIIFSLPVYAESPERSDLQIHPDSWFTGSAVEVYREDLDRISTYTAYTSLLLPAILLTQQQENLWDLPLAYSAAVGTAYLGKTAGKQIFRKRRPAAYINEFGIDDEDAFSSFPSGHTTMSFAASSFLTMAFMKTHRDAALAVPVTVLSWSLSSVTGFLRYASGSHTPRDVFTGAVLGSLIGAAAGYLLY